MPCFTGIDRRRLSSKRRISMPCFTGIDRRRLSSKRRISMPCFTGIDRRRLSSKKRIRHVNPTKSYLHFDRFAGEAILCSNFFCFSMFLDVLFLS